MTADPRQAEIAALWERRETLTPADAAAKTLVDAVLDDLDVGALRVAEKLGGAWVTHVWLKQAVLLSFRLTENRIMGPALGVAVTGPTSPDSSSPGPWWDKVPTKFAGWTPERFRAAGFRVVPGAVVRRGAYVAPGAVLMPSFVNIGAYVGPGSMVDTWATVGSCAQIGRDVHISGGAGIGGVLEPLQSAPTIIEDGCFIGARSEVAEGVVVEQGAVLSMGVYLGASTRIVDRETGQVHRGRVPAYSVVVPGTLGGGPDPAGGSGRPALYCAVIVKRVDAQTRSKTSINELLRD